MRVLELFAGTGSVGDVCRRLGHEVISLDRDLHAAIECDIMDWDYRTYQPKHFDFIWASPPCQECSKAKTKGVGKIEEANKLIQKRWKGWLTSNQPIGQWKTHKQAK